MPNNNPFRREKFSNSEYTEFTEPPPPYDASPPKRAKTFKVQLNRLGAETIVVPGEDTLGETAERLEQLKAFDIAVLVDDSGSMAGRRWEEARKAITTLAPFLAQFDQDGIDLYFLNARPSRASSRKLKDPNVVDNTFNEVTPSGRTPLGDRIQAILDPYLQDYEENIKTARAANREPEMNSLFLLVITDGKEEGHRLRTEDAIVKVARKLDKLGAPPRQIGIQFLQIGQIEDATVFLEKLDDDLENKHKIRDMVDTVTYKAATGLNGDFTPAGLVKIMLGAVLKEFDNKGLRVLAQEISGMPQSQRYKGQLSASPSIVRKKSSSGKYGDKEKESWISKKAKKIFA